MRYLVVSWNLLFACYHSKHSALNILYTWSLTGISHAHICPDTALFMQCQVMFHGTAISMWLCHYTYTTNSKFRVIYHQQFVKLWQTSLPSPQWLIAICHFCLSFALNCISNFMTLRCYSHNPLCDPATHLPYKINWKRPLISTRSTPAYTYSQRNK